MVVRVGLGDTVESGCELHEMREAAKHISNGQAFWQKEHFKTKSLTVQESTDTVIFSETDWFSATWLAGDCFTHQAPQFSTEAAC